MAIEKIKRASKPAKRQADEVVESTADLETKRQLFQEIASRKKPIHAITSKAEPETKAQPKHHGSGKRTLMIIVAAVAAVIATSMCAYAYFWYQNPTKIVFDAIMNATSSQSTQFSGTMNLFESADSQIHFDGTAKNAVSQLNTTVKLAPEGNLSSVHASVIFDHDDMYAKIDKASQLVAQAPDDIRSTLTPYTSIIQKNVDNTWIKVQPDDFTDFKSITFISQCMIDVTKRLTSNQSSTSAAMDLYRKSPFFTVHESTKPSDTTGKYQLQFDSARYDSFRDKLIHSKFFASLAGCSAKNDVPTSAQLAGTNIELTIDKSDRRITHVAVTAHKKTISAISLDPTFGTAAPVAVPKNAQSLDDIKSNAAKDYLTNLFKQLK